jgi:RNA polymerase sigma factor (sigma-70 family)
MDLVQQAVDQLYKSHFGRMVALLVAYSKDIDFSTAEDIAQETFSVALNDWRQNGIPVNPAGWVYTVCRNKAVNQLRKLANTVSANPELPYEEAFRESPVEDPQLKLLFTCANPDLPPKSQVAITLKYVVGLKVDAIARLLGMTIDGIDKILVRARQKIKAANLLRDAPGGAWQSRLPIVTKIIYLIFNEGYRSSWGKELIREELCEEALTLNHALAKSDLATPATFALQALMLFNSARIKSRFDDRGEIIELEKQDRTLWDASLIELGTDFLDRSKDDALSSYHLEASIAYLHCTAKNFDSTPWPLIARLYEQLLRHYPNPFAEINYAISLFYSGDRSRALQILTALQQHPFFHQHFLLTVTLGKLYLLDGEQGRAKAFLRRASEQTSFDAEKRLIGKMMQEVS